MRNVSRSLLLVSGIAAVLMTGCAQKVKVKALEPAEIERAAVTKTIAVSEFKSDSVGLSQKIEAKISATKLDNTPYFTTVSRSDLDRVLKEQRMQNSGLMDEDKAVEIGKLIGAQALISGAISSTSMQDNSYRESRRKCLDKKCKRVQEYTVPCTKRTIAMGAQIKMVDVAKGDIIHGSTMQESADWAHCSDDSRALPAKADGLEKLSNVIADKFVYKLAPHYVYYYVVLLEDPDLEYSDAQKKNLEVALEFIKHNRYDRAEKLLADLMETTGGKSYVAAYNLGVIKEAQGQLSEAKDLYKMADELTVEPVEEINNAINRIDQAIEKRDRALKQIAVK